MLSWDDCQTTCQDLASDSTSDTLTFMKRMMNVGYKFILNQLGRTVTEKIQTALTVANQQFYQLPPDYLFLKSVTVTVGGIAYPIQEEESQDIWDTLNATTTQTSDYPLCYFLRPSFGVSGAEIGFYPTPATAGRTITIVYEATDKDLSQDKYTTGTVSVTNGSATITGSGTTFTANMVGRYFKVTSESGDGFYYRIASFTSVTSITLENVYEGSSGSGLNYEIVEMFNLPEEMQILPCYFALYHYYMMKKELEREREFRGLFYDELKLGMRRHATKSRGALVRGKRYLKRWQMWAPTFFPTSVV